MYIDIITALTVNHLMSAPVSIMLHTVVVDSLVLLDDITENIEKLEDFVQVHIRTIGGDFTLYMPPDCDRCTS